MKTGTGIYLGLAIALSLLLVSGVAPVMAATRSTFATTSDNVIGIAAAPGKLLVTTYCVIPREDLSFDSAGTSSIFASLPADSRGGGCAEDYLAISPGLGGFTSNDVFVDQGPNIIFLSPIGTFLGVFATIPSLPADHNGIIFDHVGTFGFDLIVVGFNGEVWRINSAGTKTLVASVGANLEGPDVAPLAFAPFGGQVLAASENTGHVYAISSGGVVSVAADWPSAEFVHFVPPNPCSFGTSGGSLFTVHYPTTIFKYPASDLAPLSGTALVTSEFAGTIGILTSSGGSITSSTFDSGIGQQEGATITDCEVPPTNSVPGFNSPGIIVAAVGLIAIISVRFITLKRGTSAVPR